MIIEFVASEINTNCFVYKDFRKFKTAKKNINSITIGESTSKDVGDTI